ncbi:hypothetical protein FS749_001493 [Ceratobasidium sp. UAMH 11750]|nr:hypothetical protein FS749_001493 [Ceratobasidium sp. UAMH 11750]
MHAFTRLTSFLLFVLSLSFLTCALPTLAPAGSQDLAVRTGSGQDVLDIVLDLKAKVKAEVAVLTGCGTVAEVKAEVDVIVDLVEVAAKVILGVGAHIEVDADIKAKIAVEVAAIISVIVQACLSVSVKIGLVLVIAIFAKIDVCLQLLLVNLGICIEGIVAVIAKLVVRISVEAIIKLHLNLCASLLTIVGL